MRAPSRTRRRPIARRGTLTRSPPGSPATRSSRLPRRPAGPGRGCARLAHPPATDRAIGTRYVGLAILDHDADGSYPLPRLMKRARGCTVRILAAPPLRISIGANLGSRRSSQPIRLTSLRHGSFMQQGKRRTDRDNADVLSRSDPAAGERCQLDDGPALAPGPASQALGAEPGGGHPGLEYILEVCWGANRGDR